MAINDSVIRVSLDLPQDLYLRMRDAALRRTEAGPKGIKHRQALIEALELWLAQPRNRVAAPRPAPNRPRCAP